MTKNPAHIDAATAANLLKLYAGFMAEGDDEEKKADLHWRIQMKIIGARPQDRNTEEGKYDDDRAARLAQLHPLSITTAEQEAEAAQIMAEIIAEATAEQADEAAGR